MVSEASVSCRLALVWAGDPQWTKQMLSVDDTKPGDSSINLRVSGETSSEAMPLAAEQARDLAAELIIRADIIDPRAGA